MRFIHTADWQIGMKAAHVGQAGERVRQARLLAADRVIELATEREAEFILIAGDTFEDNGVDRRLVDQIAEILGRFPRPIFVLSGNHDPLTPGSVWEHPVWKRHSQVIIPRTNEPMAIPGGKLFPAPLFAKYSTHDPTLGIDARDCSEIAIGLAHGTVQRLAEPSNDFPIPDSAATRTGLDYLALGHWHSFASYPDSAGVVRLAYSGTHETTKFGERDSGNVLLVEIATRGSAPQITPLSSGTLRWEVLEETIREAHDLETLNKRLQAAAQPQNSLFDIRLRGILSPQMETDLERLRSQAAKFCYARIDDSGLHPSPTDHRWLEELPAGVLRQTAEELQRYAEPEAVRPAGITAEIATTALVDLYRFWRETQS